jgi:hypothetical protein
MLSGLFKLHFLPRRQPNSRFESRDEARGPRYAKGKGLEMESSSRGVPESSAQGGKGRGQDKRSESELPLTQPLRDLAQHTHTHTPSDKPHSHGECGQVARRHHRVDWCVLSSFLLLGLLPLII